MNQLRQRIHIRRFQLGNLPILDHFRRQFVLLFHLFQDVRRRRSHLAFAPPRRRLQGQLFEHNLPHLRRRVHLEFPPPQLPNLFFHPPAFFLPPAPHLPPPVPIHPKSGAFP